jgi:hypothetical protein
MPRADSRKPAGESGICGLSCAGRIGVSESSALRRPRGVETDRFRAHISRMGTPREKPPNPTVEQARNALILLGYNAAEVYAMTPSQLRTNLGLPRLPDKAPAQQLNGPDD